jgi:multiple antibiotic resistance protein
MHINIKEILSAFIVLFAVIDILGSLPIVISMKNKGLKIHAFQAAFVSFLLLIGFLYIGEGLLSLFGVDISSFAIAGSLVLFIMAIEMLLGVEIFRHDSPGSASIVPLAFPLIAGAGSFTTLLSLRAEFAAINIIFALIINMILVYIVLKSTYYIERLIGINGIYVMKKFFGIILLAMAVKLFFSNISVLLTTFAQPK